jgi:hypothetical protein
LKSVRLPNNSNFNTLRTNVFYNCTSLEGIIIPNTVRTIQPGCFFNCRLNSITFNNATTLTSISATNTAQNNLTMVVSYNSKVESLSTAHKTLQREVFDKMSPKPGYRYA